MGSALKNLQSFQEIPRYCFEGMGKTYLFFFICISHKIRLQGHLWLFGFLRNPSYAICLSHFNLELPTELPPPSYCTVWEESPLNEFMIM